METEKGMDFGKGDCRTRRHPEEQQYKACRLKSEMRLGVFCSCSHLMHHLTDKTICRTISLASSPPLVENMWSN